MEFNDTFAPARGEIEIEVYRKGALVETIVERNLVVDKAKEMLSRLLGGGGLPISHIGFGTGTVAPAVGDTALTNATIKAIDSATYPAVDRVQFVWSLASGEANGKTITEYGLFDDNATRRLFARRTRGGIVKDADITLSGTWTIIF